MRGRTPTSQEMAANLLGAAAVDALAFEDQVADDAFFQSVESAADLLGRVLGCPCLRGRNSATTRSRSSLICVGAGRLAGRLLGVAELVVELLAGDVLDAGWPAGRRQLPWRAGPPWCAALRSASMILTICLWPNMNRLQHLSSGISRAKPSIMVMASRVPATIRSRSLSSICECVGMTTSSPPMRPTRTAPVDFRNGICERCRAALAPIMHRMSGSFSRSAESVERHDLDFVDVAGREERPDGAVDEPRGENFLGGGPAFALDEAAGELAGGVGLFAVIDGEGEEVAASDRRCLRRR